MKVLTRYETSRMSNSDVRKEYSRLRAIANKRIGRLQEQNLNLGDWWAFPKIKELQSESAIESALLDVSNFLRSERTTVTGQKQFLAEFKEDIAAMGYGNLVATVEDIKKMIKFMEYMRESYTDALFDSGDALDVLEQAQRLKIPYDKVVKYYDQFQQNLSELENVKPSKNGKEFSQYRIRNLLKKWDV